MTFLPLNSIANVYNQVFLYSPSLGGPLLYKPPVTEVVYVTTEQTASRPVSRDVPSSLFPVDRDAKGNRRQAHASDSADSATSSPSTVSGGPGDHLLQPSPPAPVGSPQTHVQPPANDDPVQYAQIKHQDKL